MKKNWGVREVAAAMGLSAVVSPAFAQQADATATPDSYWSDSAATASKVATTEAPVAPVSQDPKVSDPAGAAAQVQENQRAAEPEPQQASAESPAQSTPDAGSSNPESSETTVAQDAQSTEAFAASEPPADTDQAPPAEVGFFDGMNWDWGGFIRSETAISTTGSDNPNNQHGNLFNNVSVPRQAFLPPALLAPLPATWSTLPAVGFASPGKRPVSSDDSAYNYGIVRGELEGAVNITSAFKVIGRVRGIYDVGLNQGYDAHNYDDLQGGVSGGDPGLYQGKVNQLGYRVDGDKNPNPLEWSGKDYQVYFPALFLQYNQGALDLRIGQQQIAWGQAIFFRVLDIPDGLDLRRHSVLDYAQEEFSDKRVPALAVRASYQLTDDILTDAYVQKFQPTILGNPNTTYNVIPAQFTIHDQYHEGGYDDKLRESLNKSLDTGVMIAAMYSA